MLQTMRNLAQSWVFKGLMLILVVSFGIWGIGDIFRGNPMQRVVAKSGKISVTVENLRNTFNQALTQMHESLGPDITRQQAMQMGLLDRALNDLLERAAVEQDVTRLGLDVSGKQFIATVAAMPQFHDKDGKFDKATFRRVLDQINMNERTYMDGARKQMAQQQLFNTLRNEVKLPQTITDNLYRARGQKRILDVISVKNEGFGDIPAPDDGALNDYYQQHAAEFVAPEYRALTVVKLATEDIAKDIMVSDEDVRNEFTAKSAQLAGPEHRDLVQAIFKDEATAKKVTQQAQGGNFSTAAKNAGGSPMPLNNVDQKTILPELAQPVFSLKEGQVSEPVKSPLGWHVVQVKKITPAGIPDFESVKETLKAGLKRDRALDAVTRVVNDLDDQLAAGHSLEDIADSMKLRLVKVSAVDSEGKTPDGKEPQELPMRDQTLKAAFGQSSGDTSPVLDDRNGNYIVVRTDDVSPSTVPPLDQIKDRVISAWRKSEQSKRAASAADDIAKALRDGKAPSSFAAQRGVDVRVSKPISLMGDEDPELSETLLPQIIRMKKGEVAVVPMPREQVVLRLADIVETDPAANKNEVGKLATAIHDQFPIETVSEYVRYLHVLFPVDIYQGVVESLKQEGS